MVECEAANFLVIPLLGECCGCAGIEPICASRSPLSAYLSSARKKTLEDLAEFGAELTVSLRLQAAPLDLIAVLVQLNGTRKLRDQRLYKRRAPVWTFACIITDLNDP